MTSEEFHRLRVQSGLSMRKLAAKLGVSYTSVYRWGKGDIRSIPSEVADRLRSLALAAEHRDAGA